MSSIAPNLLEDISAFSIAAATVASTVFAVPVEVPPEGEYVADGAAVQVVRALNGESVPPIWSAMNRGETRIIDPVHIPEIQERYSEICSNLYG